ncbi:hypothetical protein G647_03812 [Cladophialophora carrionii CBS 160.54]|uniref:Xylanolytic transcriptional activator regulatory domain-containing protein n=1 Tax=Cladophialophora carrionii CBS 160.54 TaxID=1279043 RepID=V9DDQ0_9EURO|nr:uncharacterized protein G647_03812 [Cladophialophora carrionii CBS 160.54]ETI24443.1 hypothetical protein G647_03812 [Cladophialophora carrionii CBS 160.54]
MYQPEDPSLMYSATAMQASYYLGLQRSVETSSRSFAVLPPDDRQAMSRTWLGCFAIHTALSISHGNPPMVKSPTELSALDANLEKHQIPHRLAFEVEVQRCMAKYHDSLVGGAENSVYETPVQMCEQELNSLVDRYHSSMDAYLALHLDTTLLHLYTLAILRTKSGLRKIGRSNPRGHIIRYQKLGMLAAHRVIDIYCDSLRSPDTCLIDVYRALPKQFFVGVLHATFFLLRYFVLNPACEGEVKAESRNKVLMVHAKLKASTIHQLAEPG